MAITDPEDTRYTRDQLEEKTVAELRELAAERDVALPSGANKAEIVEAVYYDQDEEQEAGGEHVDQRGQSVDDGLGSVGDTITRTIEDPPAGGGSIATSEERMTRISAQNIGQAPTDQWIDYVQTGEDDGVGDQNVQAAVLTEPIFLLWGDPEEAKLQAGDYIVRDGNGDLVPVRKGDFASRYAKPESDVPGKQVQEHPAVAVLVKTIQLITERPGDAANVAQIYAWADEVDVDLRSAVASGPSEKP